MRIENPVQKANVYIAWDLGIMWHKLQLCGVGIICCGLQLLGAFWDKAWGQPR